MRTHELKTWPDHFQAVVDGRKCFELRQNDRHFCVGDRLRLREFSLSEGYTGREAEADVVYIVYGGQSGLPEGLCIMSLGNVEVSG